MSGVCFLSGHAADAIQLIFLCFRLHLLRFFSHKYRVTFSACSNLLATEFDNVFSFSSVTFPFSFTFLISRLFFRFPLARVSAGAFLHRSLCGPKQQFLFFLLFFFSADFVFPHALPPHPSVVIFG